MQLLKFQRVLLEYISSSDLSAKPAPTGTKRHFTISICESTKKYDSFRKKFLAIKSIFFKILKIDTILYTFYSECYADSESVTLLFLRFTSIFREILTVKVWPKSQ